MRTRNNENQFTGAPSGSAKLRPDGHAESSSAGQTKYKAAPLFIKKRRTSADAE